jgi:CIC family chloride channel protein
MLCKAYYGDRPSFRSVAGGVLTKRPPAAETAVPMKSKPQVTQQSEERPGNLLTLALLAPIVGAASGLLGAVFRLTLVHADHLRDGMIAWAHGQKAVGFLLVTTACATGPAVAAWLVRRFSPLAAGSGIPHVEAIIEGELPEAPFRLIPVKFFGGLLAIGSGLALGREGPTVQMGASTAHLVGKIFKRNWPDCRVLLAAGAGAGLATAFNAPIAGAIFVLEELVRRFEPRIAIVALGASSAAIAVARLFLGDAPDFHVQALAFPNNGAKLLFVVLGVLTGLAAIAYNRAILGALAVTDKLRYWPVELRAAIIGAAVGALAWIAPGSVGSGNPITQNVLDGAFVLTPLIFLIRFGLGPISYAAATPGGLFAPLLAVGAQLGVIFGVFCQFLFAGLHLQPEAFAVVGMAAFFAGVVRAPLTGIVLVTEMTGSVTMLLPMLGACFATMLLTTLLGSPPIYDSLLQRTEKLKDGEWV